MSKPKNPKGQPEAAQPEAVKPPRAIELIQKEYEEACLQIGERSYKRALVEAEITQLHQRMLALNQEASVVQAQAQLEATKAAQAAQSAATEQK